MVARQQLRWVDLIDNMQGAIKFREKGFFFLNDKLIHVRVLYQVFTVPCRPKMQRDWRML